MMKRYLAVLLVGLGSLPVRAQNMTDYYQLPDHQSQYTRVLNRYGGAYIRDRWYVSLGGFARTDRAKLDNSFNGLIESNTVTKLGWSALVGWVYRERWGVEGGYANLPVHTEVLVNNGYSPFTFRYANSKQAFGVRGRRLLVSTSGPWHRSGIWVSGGLWLVPNGGQDKQEFALAGYAYPNRRWEKPDTLRLTGETTVNTRLTALAEVGIEYNVRLSNNIDMGFSLRKYWGMGNAVTTNLRYNVNSQDVQQAQLRGMGNGMSLGISLRYTYGLHQNLPNVLNVQGRRRTE